MNSPQQSNCGRAVLLRRPKTLGRFDLRPSITQLTQTLNLLPSTGRDSTGENPRFVPLNLRELVSLSAAFGATLSAVLGGEGLGVRWREGRGEVVLSRRPIGSWVGIKGEGWEFARQLQASVNIKVLLSLAPDLNSAI